MTAMAPSMENSSDLANTGRIVAEWCVGDEREEAVVAISAATELASAMRDFWRTVHTFARAEGPVGRQLVLAFPRWPAAADRSFYQRVLQHIQECSEVCEYLGNSMTIAGRHPAAMPEATGGPASPRLPCPVILLRSYAQPELNAYEDAQSGAVATDAEVLAATRAWVEAVIVKMKVCPFSSTADRAGLPAGGVSYPLTHASTGEEIYEQFWEQVLKLARTDERALSTVLLVTPRFALHSPGGFDVFADTLNGALTQLNLEESVQLVFFHPGFVFRDGKDRAGVEDGAANFARRSPYPMINLLRTPQVRKAQKGLPTGSVYTTNERNLKTVGAIDLQRMLEARDWRGVHGREYAPHAENTWK